MQNTPTLSPDYWDCECEHHYIHPRAVLACSVCGTTQEDGPDSHMNEIGIESAMALPDLSMPVSALPDLRPITIRTDFTGQWVARQVSDKAIIARHKTLGGLLAKLTQTMKG